MKIQYDLKERDSATLVVTLPGAVNRKAFGLPYFEWGRSMEGRAESYLRLSDPTLELNDRLTLGWFIGTEAVHGHQEAAALIQEKAKEIGADKIITVGSSGGGFAALAISAYMPGSIGLAFSPSTTIDRVTPAHTQNFLQAAFPDIPTYSELFARFPERVSLESLYSSDHANHFYLIQNAGDTSRMQRSFIPFSNSLGLEAEGGKTAGGRWNLVVEQHGEGHIPPPKERFHHWLDVAVEL